MSDTVERFVDVPGGYIYCRTKGHGPDVVLFNIATADLRMWDSTVDWLAAVARVTTFDPRDTGLSSAGAEPFGELDDIAAVLDATGVSSAVLVGCSDGARRALAFAHDHPERVKHVVAASGAFGDFPDPTPEEAAARQEMLETFVQIDDLVVKAGVRAAAEFEVDAWGPALDAAQRRKMVGWAVANTHRITLAEYLGKELEPPVKTRFSEITTPITVLVGGRDFRGTQLWSRRLAEQAPKATLTFLPEADHFPMFSAPRAFEHLLREAIG